MAACEEVCLAELAKPEETRAPIPSTIIDLVPEDAPVEAITTEEPSTEDSVDDEDNNNPFATTGDNTQMETTTDEQPSTLSTEQLCADEVDDDGDNNDQFETTGDEDPMETTTREQLEEMEDYDGNDNDAFATTGDDKHTETTREERSSTEEPVDADDDNSHFTSPPNVERTESPPSGGDDNPSLTPVVSDLEEQRSDASESEAEEANLETEAVKASLNTEAEVEYSSKHELAPVVCDHEAQQPEDGEQDDVLSTSSEKSDGKRELFRADTPSTKKARTDSGVNNDATLEDDDGDNTDDEATHCFDVPAATPASVCDTPPTTGLQKLRAVGSPKELHATGSHYNNLVTPAVKSTASTEDSIQTRRTQLESLLSLRVKGKNSAVDGLCQRIQQKIDDLDEELFELINTQF